MRGLVLLITLLFSIALQSTVLAKISLFGVTPDLILVITVCYGLLHGPVKGLFFGLLGGFLLDLSGGGILGLHTLIKAVLGYGAGFLEKTVFKDNILVPALALVIATFMQGVISLLILITFDWQGRFLTHFVYTVLPLSIYHPLLTVPVYYGVLKLTDRNHRGLGRGGMEF
ncbi:MAG TPA: rod shape-determining protein MreD [Bacillota bacterium]